MFQEKLLEIVQENIGATTSIGDIFVIGKEQHPLR
jgi:hypothetical protein